MAWKRASLIFQGALTGSMVMLSSSLAWSASGAQKLEILRIQFRTLPETALTDLKMAATRSGMECFEVLLVAQGHRAPPPAPGIRCSLDGSGGSFDASSPGPANLLLVQISSNNGSTPRGDVDPIIGQLLGAYEKSLVDNHQVTDIEECFSPAFARCLVDSAR
jgi:hypothetical protein